LFHVPAEYTKRGADRPDVVRDLCTLTGRLLLTRPAVLDGHHQTEGRVGGLRAVMS
jgi:hypothetical protein